MTTYTITEQFPIPSASVESAPVEVEEAQKEVTLVKKGASDILDRDFVKSLKGWGRVTNSEGLDYVDVGKGFNLNRFFFHYDGDYVVYIEKFIAKTQYLDEDTFPSWKDVDGEAKSAKPLTINSLKHTGIDYKHLIE